MRSLFLACVALCLCSCYEHPATKKANWEEILRVANPSKTYEFVFLRYNPGAMSSYEYSSRIVEFGHIFTDQDFAADHTVVAPSSLNREHTKWLDDTTVQVGIGSGPVYFCPVYRDIDDGKVKQEFHIKLHIQE